MGSQRDLHGISRDRDLWKIWEIPKISKQLPFLAKQFQNLS
jgi:hypothetical protein